MRENTAGKAAKNNRSVGAQKEHLAAEFLRRHGYVILEANYRCRQGEIDLIAEKDAYLVFVEVKYRSGNRFGSPIEAVDRQKQRKICYTAEHYLMKRGLSSDTPVRFDVVAITGNRIRLIPAAFSFVT